MRSVIIPAAGLATRMKPLSKGVSKAMIPVNGRPLISYIIEHVFKEGDVDEMVIVENEIGDISEFVARVYPTFPIKCVVQAEKLGPLHAINVGFTALEHENTAVTIWLGDTICLEDFPYRRDFLAVHHVADPHRWCVVDEDGNLYDKPDTEVPTNKALIGVYNFTNRKSFNRALASGMKKPTYKGEYQIAGLLEAYRKTEGPMELVFTQKWYDCGELNTYYESKARLLSKSARSFNKISVDTFYGTVWKSSEDSERQAKIEAEKMWFAGLDEEQSLFCPRILDSEYGTLRMSLEPGIALNEVLVYDNLRTDVWHGIIRKILQVHHDVFLSYIEDETASSEEASMYCFEQYFTKTKKRIAEIRNHVKITPWHEDFMLNTGLSLCKHPVWSQVMHGDSHLGNIIYDPHSGNIKFVDPRGSFGKTWTQGDLRYDLGKLLQDFYCGYAMIMAKRYTWTKNEYGNDEVEINWVPGTEKLSEFLEAELETHGYEVDLLKRLAVMLLITAIPFHADDPDRQRAMFVRGKQLIKELTDNSNNN
jgi:dTDP-glucose pyrophosphorylase